MDVADLLRGIQRRVDLPPEAIDSKESAVVGLAQPEEELQALPKVIAREDCADVGGQLRVVEMQVVQPSQAGGVPRGRGFRG